MATKNNKKSKKNKKHGLNHRIIIIGTSLAAIVIIAILLVISINNRKITLHDLNTHYNSLSLKVSYSNNCADEEYWRIDYTAGNSFGEIKNATEDKYNCKRYFLGSRKQMYQKVYAAGWSESDINGEYPDSRITKVLEYISKSSGELLSEEDGVFTFGVKNLQRPQEIYEYLNDISALGNNWGADNYKSLSAKIYIHRNGDVLKIIFYPISKSTETSWYSYATNSRLMYLTSQLKFDKNKKPADYDYIRSCKEITWTFSNLNSTRVDYKEDLWEVLN